MSASPAVEGWFTTGPEPTLLGSRCTTCATVCFPPVPRRAGFCRNPACDGEEFETAELSPARHGVVLHRRAVPAAAAVRRRAPTPTSRSRWPRSSWPRGWSCWARSPTATASRTSGSAPRSSWWSRPARRRPASLDLALEARHRAGRGGRPVSARRRRPRRRHAPVGQVGPPVRRRTACTPPGPRWPTPASTGATSTSSSAARRSATATPATSPARPSPRPWAGTAPASRRRTPPARPAPRRSTPPAPGSWPGCARSRWWSAPTPRRRASWRPTRGSGGTTRTGCGSGCSA